MPTASIGAQYRCRCRAAGQGYNVAIMHSRVATAWCASERHAAAMVLLVVLLCADYGPAGYRCCTMASRAASQAVARRVLQLLYECTKCSKINIQFWVESRRGTQATGRNQGFQSGARVEKQRTSSYDHVYVLGACACSSCDLSVAGRSIRATTWHRSLPFVQIMLVHAAVLEYKVYY